MHRPLTPESLRNSIDPTAAHHLALYISLLGYTSNYCALLNAECRVYLKSLMHNTVHFFTLLCFLPASRLFASTRIVYPYEQ